MDGKGKGVGYMYEEGGDGVKGDEMWEVMQKGVVGMEERGLYEQEGVELEGNVGGLWGKVVGGGVWEGGGEGGVWGGE